MERTGTERTFLAARSLKKLISDLPTPFYLYDEKGIRSGFRTLASAFSAEPGLKIRFPMRVNRNIAILRLLKENGCGVVCRSTGELMLAKQIGFFGDEVIYAPLLPEEAGIRLADEMDAIRLVDKLDALPNPMPRRALLCFNPGGRLKYGYDPVADLDREVTGLPEEELMKAAKWLRNFGTESIGICMMSQPMEANANYYPAAAQALFRLAVRLRRQLGITVDCCDLGEGLGWFESQGPDEKALLECAGKIQALRRQILAPEGLDGIKLAMMPGRYLIGRHGLFVTRVMLVKESNVYVAVVDGSFSSFLRPSLYMARHPVVVLGKGDAKERYPYMVVGPTGDWRDRFGRGYKLPELKKGDVLVIGDAGMEGSALMSNYGMIPRCAEYLVCGADKVECIQKAQSSAELVESLL